MKKWVEWKNSEGLYTEPGCMMKRDDKILVLNEFSPTNGNFFQMEEAVENRLKIFFRHDGIYYFLDTTEQIVGNRCSSLQ